MANPGYPNVIAVRQDTDDTPQDLEMAGDTKSLKVALYCYNPDTLAWERMRQPQISPLADEIPGHEKFEYSSNLLIYKGMHATQGASTADTSWLIWRFTYDGNELTDIEFSEGAWENRAGLWA